MSNRSKVFAVTGATGNTGSRLTELLLEQGHEVRAIARGTERLKALAMKGAVARPGSVEDAAFLAGAFEGVDGAFLMVPPHYTTEDMREYQHAVTEAQVQAVRQARVQRVVALSSIGAHRIEGTGPISGLHYQEARLGTLEDTHVLSLRAGFFMENFLQGIDLIKQRGVAGSPIAPDRALPMIATRDIADAAAEHLVKGDFEGTGVRYLLGPRDLTMAEATSVLGQAIGKPDLKYVQFSYDDTRRSLMAAGLSKSVAESFLEMYRAMNGGRLEPTEPRSPKNTTPTRIDEWSRVFAAAYSAHRTAKSA